VTNFDEGAVHRVEARATVDDANGIQTIVAKVPRTGCDIVDTK
jgi:hypothetical protein